MHGQLGNRLGLHERNACRAVYDREHAWATLCSNKTLQPPGQKIDVQIVDVLPHSSLPLYNRSTIFTDQRELRSYLDHTSCSGGTRFISLYQRNSWAGLQLDEPTLRAIVDKHQIMPEFLEIVRSFQDKTSNVEEAYSGNFWKCSTANSKEIAFVLKYPEHNGRTDGVDPWSIRQTGVYQKYDCDTRTSLWILLNPKQNTAALDRVANFLELAPYESTDSRDGPPLLGIIVLSTYILNWRTYMASFEKEILKLNRQALSYEINDTLAFGHSTLSKLGKIDCKLQVLAPILTSVIEYARQMMAFQAILHASCNENSNVARSNAINEVLENHIITLNAYSSNAAYLLEKSRKTAQLFSDTLNMKSQVTAQKVGENTLALTRSAAKDSATIRVITVVTLLYLPSTFIATIFGMQFFSAGPDGRLTMAAPQIWIFFVFAAPFTAATFAYWRWNDRRLEKMERVNSIKSTM